MNASVDNMTCQRLRWLVGSSPVRMGIFLFGVCLLAVLLYLAWVREFTRELEEAEQHLTRDFRIEDSHPDSDASLGSPSAAMAGSLMLKWSGGNIGKY